MQAPVGRPLSRPPFPLCSTNLDKVETTFPSSRRRAVQGTWVGLLHVDQDCFQNGRWASPRPVILSSLTAKSLTKLQALQYLSLPRKAYPQTCRPLRRARLSRRLLSIARSSRRSRPTRTCLSFMVGSWAVAGHPPLGQPQANDREFPRCLQPSSRSRMAKTSLRPPLPACLI